MFDSFRGCSRFWFRSLETIQNIPNTLVFTLAFFCLNSTNVWSSSLPCIVSETRTSLQLAFSPDWVGVQRRNLSKPSHDTSSNGKQRAACCCRGLSRGLSSTTRLMTVSCSLSGTASVLFLHSWIQTSLVWEVRDPSGRSTNTPLHWIPPPDGPNMALATAVKLLGSGHWTL